MGNNPVRYRDLWGLFRVDKDRGEGVVEPGDTLSAIAYQVYGAASLYRELAAVNQIPDPGRIYAGQRLQLPTPLTEHGPNARAADADVFVASVGAVLAVEVGGPLLGQVLKTAAVWVATKVQTWLMAATPSAKDGTAAVRLWPSKYQVDIVISGRRYAEIGGRLYTEHALKRIAPAGFGGRGVPPSVVEHAIQYGLKTSGKFGRTVYTFENIRVITEDDIVVSVIRLGN